MSITRTAAPGGVESFLCFLHQTPVHQQTSSTLPDLLRTLTSSADPSFWETLFTKGLADWPSINAASIRLAEVPNGCIFTVEDEQGLLVMGGVGGKNGGIAWEKLTETVNEIREKATAFVQQSPGGKELLEHWQEETTPPTGENWLTLVPMIGLRYYGPDVERILTLTGKFGNDLLTIHNRDKHLN